MKRQKNIYIFNVLKIEVFGCFPNSRKTPLEPLSDIFYSNHGKTHVCDCAWLKTTQDQFYRKRCIFII